MLPSKIDQMKVSHETRSEANFGFGHALMPSCLVFGCSHCVTGVTVIFSITLNVSHVT